MEYTTLGSTGMKVSKICLGTMSFGRTAEYGVTNKQAIDIVDRAVELGINFFDTANVYSSGESEILLGDALSQYDSDEQVVATKVRWPSNKDHPNAAGLSRKTIEQELELSRDRLGVDTIDLYQIHRWDDQTPIEETLRTLDDTIRRNQVRYIGASSMWAHQFQSALHTSDRLDLERFQTMQNHYNLVYREEEREMTPLCEKAGVGCIPWSPLGRGFLARPHDEFSTTKRGKNDAETKAERLDIYRSNGGIEINERVQELAEEKGVSMAQISLAWLLAQEAVDAPIVGITSIDHLEDAVEAVDLSLSDSDIDYLEEPYEPGPITGH